MIRYIAQKFSHSISVKLFSRFLSSGRHITNNQLKRKCLSE
jgi:hypothetical protein